MSETIRVLLVDDHPPFRMGMRVLLEQNPDIVVVGEAGTGAETLEQADIVRPDVVVLDCQLPDVDGPAIATDLQRQDEPPHILALSAYDDVKYVRGMLAAGATGYLLKNEAAETIVAAVQAAAAGKAYFSASVAAQLMQLARHDDDSIDTPTEREMEVLALLAAGQTNAEIAHKLGISERTVRFHVENLFSRLGVGNRVEAVMAAIARGWVDAP